MFIEVFAGSYYNGGYLRLPFGARSQALGGISALKDGHVFINNPSISYGKNYDFYMSVSRYSLDRREGMLSINMPLKNRLGLSFQYIYRGIVDIPLYSVSEELYDNVSDIVHIGNFALNYMIINKKKYSIKIGFGTYLLYHKLLNATDNRRFNNFALGFSGKIFNFDYGLGISNIFAKNNWSIITGSVNGYDQKEMYNGELPIKVVGGLKYKIKLFTLFYQLDAEDLSYAASLYKNRLAVLYNYKLLDIIFGYGDERISGGFNIRFPVKNIPFRVSVSVFDDKLIGFNSSMGINFNL